MTFNQGRILVGTPASAANLGPGYDTLGLALTMRDRLEAEVLDDGLEVDVRGEGADDLPRDRSHLVVRAMDAAFDVLGEQPSGLRLTCDNTIPHARGLGSSSAAIVGGIVLARALVEGGDERLDDASAYQLASDLEGHPDNVAAAMFGGFTIAWLDGAIASVQRLDVIARVTVLVPPEPVATEEARNLLPDRVPHRDAAANAARAALLVGALTGDPTHLLAAPRTSCTSRTAPRRCRRRTSWCRDFDRPGFRRSSPAPVPRCSRSDADSTASSRPAGSPTSSTSSREEPTS